MSLERVVPPSGEPLTLAEAKVYLRLTDDDTSQDSLIIDSIAAARELAELYCGRSFMQQDWSLTLDGFAQRIELPKPPLISVISMKYLDAGGVQRTLDPSSYRMVKGSPGYIEPAYQAVWPILRGITAQVEIVYRAGYGTDPTSLPAVAKRAMLQLVATLFEERGETVTLQSGVVPLPIRRVLDPIRVARYG
jgi:uncharacterized phiE125 gp8 family phage protein